MQSAVFKTLKWDRGLTPVPFPLSHFVSTIVRTSTATKTRIDISTLYLKFFNVVSFLIFGYDILSPTVIPYKFITNVLKIVYILLNKLHRAKQDRYNSI